MEGFLTESHIVVVGDDLIGLRQIEQVLHTDGYRRISLTTDLHRSQDFVTGREPDLVLLDLDPPQFRGLELVQSIRGQVAADSFVPILMLTTELAGVERRQALKAGANDMLTKPFDMEELSLRVARLLETRRLIVMLQREREMLASMVADQTEDRTRELIKANYELERLVRAKDEFIASVSHELRTPLTAVVGFARKLSENPDEFEDDEAAAITKIIAEQSSDVAAIIDDLLVAARADIGRLRVLSEPVDLRAEVQAASGGLSAGREAIRLPLETAVARADRLRVRQILRNLLANAIRYGGPEVTVEIIPRDQTVSVKVADDGPGIPANAREHLFEPYYHGSPTNGDPPSIGLGLTVSRHLARLMGGDLVYAQKPPGSVFELTLPSGMRVDLRP